MGFERRLTLQNEKMVSRIQELEFQLHRLIHSKDEMIAEKTSLKHEIELLRKHNIFLQERYSASVGNRNDKVELLKQPTQPLISEREKIYPDSQKDIHRLYDKVV